MDRNLGRRVRNAVSVAATSVTNTTGAFSNRTHFVDFAVKVPFVKTNDAWADQRIGVQLRSTVAPELAGGYWDVDNFRLSAITQPAFALSYAQQDVGVQISWPSAVGFQYQVRLSNDLQTWSALDAPLTGTGGDLRTIVSAASQSPAFFSVVATLTP